MITRTAPPISFHVAADVAVEIADPMTWAALNCIRQQSEAVKLRALFRTIPPEIARSIAQALVLDVFFEHIMFIVSLDGERILLELVEMTVINNSQFCCPTDVAFHVLITEPDFDKVAMRLMTEATTTYQPMPMS